MRLVRIPGLFGFAAFLLTAAAACTPSAPELSVTSAWARATPAQSSTSAVYFRIENRGGADRLLSANCGMAERTEIHETRMDGEVARMVPMTGAVPVPDSSVVSFEPGGKHVMLVGLRSPLRTNERIDVELEFERSGRKALSVLVGEPARNCCEQETVPGIVSSIERDRDGTSDRSRPSRE